MHIFPVFSLVQPASPAEIPTIFHHLFFHNLPIGIPVRGRAFRMFPMPHAGATTRSIAHFPDSFVYLPYTIRTEHMYRACRPPGTDINSGRTDLMNIIDVRNLTRQFNGFTAVDDISFEVAKGEIFAFLGPNGAGKSTTIKILTTILAPSSGQVRINGYDPLRDPAPVRRSFGIVFQDPSLDDDLTAYENMELHGVLYGVPAKARRERIEMLMKLVDLWDRRNSPAKTFSGGMKRRLEIARGLLHHPDILFLDEPTLGLDPQTRNHMWNYIREINRQEGMTVFFTTHYMEEAEKMAERIAIIDHGKIIAMGSATELRETTATDSLEGAFLALTGYEIRAEQASGTDHLRAMGRAFAGKR